MHPKLRRFIRFIREKIFLFLNILIDLGFSIVFYKIESEEKSIKMANLFKSLMTGLLNLVDMLKGICGKPCCNCCPFCSKKNPNEIDYETININLKKRMDELELTKKIKIKLRDEKNKESKDYTNTLRKYKAMEEMENEINKIIIN